MRAHMPRGLVLSVLLLTAGPLAAAPGDPPAIPKPANLTRGICVVAGEAAGPSAVSLAKASRWTILAQVRSAAEADATRRAAAEAGVLGKRLFVACEPGGRIALADDLADAVVVLGEVPARVRAEALRVLHPGGRALLGGREIAKPPAGGTDDWSHHYHGPDNNPQSADTRARAPYLTQFVSQPRYGPAPQATVAAGGRVFMAFGHVAWHEREEPWMDTLVVLNGYNGTRLWKHSLPKGVMVDRCTMVATDSTLYLADTESCKLLDAATGAPAGEIVVPAGQADGTFWKWIALSDGVLYALVGAAEKADAPAKWRRTAHGWPWNGISNGYNAARYRWGFARTLLAIDPKTKRILWRHRETGPPMDSRALCLAGGRLFVCSFGKYVACLDAKTGKPLWRKTPETDAALFEALGPFSSGHGYRTGWKSTVYLRCTDKALYFMGPQLRRLTAAAADDGRLLWSLPLESKINVHVVVRPEGLYTIGGQGTKGETRKLDPMTGKVLSTYAVSRRACTRATGTADGIFFRASGGSARLDLATGKTQCISPMRPSCHVGVVVAHGHLYWQPWVCDCNLQLFGTVCAGPAGDFAFDANADEADRLELLAADIPADGQPAAAPADDWPTYLGNNHRDAQTHWPALTVPDRVEVLWTARAKAPCEATAPVIARGSVYLAGRDGAIRALRLADGSDRWLAYTGGSVFYPPTIARGRAFVGSADGWAYAFDAADGRCLWRFRAAPADRRIRVYGQLQSTWPVASGVLVEGHLAFLAAGMTDYDGTHLYALDARTGRIRWQNNTSGHLDAFSRRGVAVQGHLLTHAGKLYLAGGNAVSPGVYDLKTGRCETPPPKGFGTRARRGQELTVVHGKVQVSGQPLYSNPENPVFDGSCKWRPQVLRGRNANVEISADKGRGRIVAFVLVEARNPVSKPPEKGKKPAKKPAPKRKVLWSHALPGEPVRWGIATAGGRIVVTCRNGDVVCFGAK